MSSKTELIICGSIAIDRIMTFAGHYKDLIQPEKIGNVAISVLLEKLEESRGGTGANISYNLAKLGDKPILLASIGKDGSEYLADLLKFGVAVEHVHASEIQTASFNVINDSEDNQVGGFYPGAMSDAESLSLEPWAKQNVFVVVSAHDPDAMRRQVEQCKRFGMRLFYDVSQQVSNISKADLLSGIEAAELIIANDYEMALLSRRAEISPTELKAKVPVVVTTHGKNGSIIEGRDVEVATKIGIAKPTNIADPTGAGDGYRAGFLYGYARNWDLAECAHLGATVASFVVEQYGSQLDFSKEDIMNRYKANFMEEIEL